MSLLHALGFHDWVPVWHEARSSLFHKVGYKCQRPGCKARQEKWPSWEDGHECKEVEDQINAGRARERNGQR